MYEKEPQTERVGPSPVMDPWVHRSSGMRCGTCIWYVPKTPNGLKPEGYKGVGRCRRHAPTIGGYPVVYITDWCGDHRLDENKA
jgi:Pyruvate/2-oxoacid:ferredoxin oxidoreductase delta subunit